MNDWGEIGSRLNLLDYNKKPPPAGLAREALRPKIGCAQAAWPGQSGRIWVCFLVRLKKDAMRNIREVGCWMLGIGAFDIQYPISPTKKPGQEEEPGRA